MVSSRRVSAVQLMLGSAVAFACDRDPLPQRLQPDLEGNRAAQHDPERPAARLRTAPASSSARQDALDQRRPGAGQATAAASQILTQPSPQQLQRYARARKEVAAINDKYAAEMSTAADPQQADALRRRASAEMVDVMHEVGLSTSEYSDIAEMVQREPLLQRKVKEYSPE